MLRTRTSLAVAAVACSLGLALSGCGGAQEDTNAPAPADAPASSAPAEAPASSAPAEEGTQDEGAAEEGADGKPAKEDVVAGYVALMQEQFGSMFPDGESEEMQQVLEDVAACFVDEVYDDASAQTLQAIADGDMTGIDPADQQLFLDASAPCQEKITEQLTNG